MNKKRFLTTIIVMVLIIILLVLIIVAASTSKTNNNLSGQQTFSSVEGDETNNTSQENENSAESENLPPVSNKNEVAIVKSEPEQETTDLPNSGPIDILPIALLLGTFTTFIFSFNLSPKRQNQVL